jgi:biotin synthase
MLHPAIEKAYAVLDGAQVDRKIFAELSMLEGGDILDLASLAGKVRDRFAGGFHSCTIMNAKSGACGEDCRFCAQSTHHVARIDRYGLADADMILDRAAEAFAAGVENFGIVTSGTGYMKMSDEFRRILESIDLIHSRYPDKNVCASLGHLSEETARELSKHDILHYNINIQTNPARYRELISNTHGVNDRIRTILVLKKQGVKICSGGIIGLGESAEDRLALAFSLKDLDVDVIPLNVLIPIPGTPLERQEPVPASEVVKTFALFRLINPSKIIKFAAGRETKMRDFQGLIMLAGANGFITGGYLTTRGREVRDDIDFRDELRKFQ